MLEQNLAPFLLNGPPKLKEIAYRTILFKKIQIGNGMNCVVFGWSQLVVVAHSFRRENKQGNTFLFPKISSVCSFQGQTHEVPSQ